MTTQEGGAVYRVPRPPLTGDWRGPSFRVDKLGKGLRFRVVSTPHPLHWAYVGLTRIPDQSWLVTVETAEVKPRLFPKGDGRLVQALSHAGAIVGALYRVDMRSKFTGPQRFAMGRNLCPHRIPCPGYRDPSRPVCDNTTSGHYHLCQKVPSDPFTVYCDEHNPHGVAQPGDVFRSLDDAAGT